MNLSRGIQATLPTLLAVVMLTACTSSAHLQEPRKPTLPPPPPLPQARAYFQFEQNVTLELLQEDPALAEAFYRWANNGLYENAPVYRQLPGIFVLTGKPRLKGEEFTPGTVATPHPKGKPLKEATSGYAGFVVHADGTVGPEIILTYGRCFRAHCEGPANVRFAKIIEGKGQLESIQRGDNMLGIAIAPFER